MSNAGDGRDQAAANHPETGGTSFTFLGLPHLWGESVAVTRVRFRSERQRR
jgi:hypothetical protein